MRLRAYRTDDARIITSWVRSEEELYKWSADRFNVYPLPPEVIDKSYQDQLKTGRFIPLTAVDEEEKVVGHFIIRYPDPNNDSSVRFGFVIVDPDIRGKGCGREMLRLGISYVKDNLTATRIDLGVFENNPKAKRCYESLGFKDYGSHEFQAPYGTWNCIDMELNI